MLESLRALILKDSSYNDINGTFFLSCFMITEPLLQVLSVRLARAFQTLASCWGYGYNLLRGKLCTFNSESILQGVGVDGKGHKHITSIRNSQ
jgi:hypothetical protein